MFARLFLQFMCSCVILQLLRLLLCHTYVLMTGNVYRKYVIVLCKETSVKGSSFIVLVFNS